MKLYRRAKQPLGWMMRRSLLGIALLVIVFLCWNLAAALTSGLQAAIAPMAQVDLAQDRIYAYRDWQSLGIRVERGDLIEVSAEGSWLYTPDEFHGPEGHDRYAAPSFYPVQGPGGSLIGRIGEDGSKFYVGRDMRITANESGILYMRINDDILSDNDGMVVVEVNVITPLTVGTASSG